MWSSFNSSIKLWYETEQLLHWKWSKSLNLRFFSTKNDFLVSRVCITACTVVIQNLKKAKWWAIFECWRCVKSFFFPLYCAVTGRCLSISINSHHPRSSFARQFTSIWDYKKNILKRAILSVRNINLLTTEKAVWNYPTDLSVIWGCKAGRSTTKQKYNEST